MKKKGMIPEHHRQAAEDKWAKVIKEIDDKKYPCQSIINDKCGYCAHASETLALDYFIPPCRACVAPTWLCNDNGSGGAIQSLKNAWYYGEYGRARKYAVKIYEYIKNDKPGVK